MSTRHDVSLEELSLKRPRRYGIKSDTNRPPNSDNVTLLVTPDWLTQLPRVSKIRVGGFSPEEQDVAGLGIKDHARAISAGWMCQQRERRPGDTVPCPGVRVLR